LAKLRRGDRRRMTLLGSAAEYSRRSRSGGRRLVVWVLGFGVAIAAVVAVSKPPAWATTDSPVGPTPPEKKMAVQWGRPLVGRHVAYRVERRAHIVSGVLDIEAITEGEPEWFYGEIALHIRVNGEPKNVVELLYPFTYIGRHHVRAELVPDSTIDAQHPYGVPIGQITFTVVKPAEEYSTWRDQPGYTKACFTFDGGGPYEIEFKRDEGSPPPAALPKAKQIRSDDGAVLCLPASGTHG
jgi:hypothetical protein